MFGTLRFTLPCLALSAAGCASLVPERPLLPRPDGRRPEMVRPALPPPQTRGVYAVDAGGRAIEALESGSTLHMGAQALQPATLYEFRARLDDGRLLSFARVTTDRAGSVEPFVLWYESGVVGCSERRVDAPDPERFRFRTFEEAENALSGRTVVITAHPIDREQASRTDALQGTARQAEHTVRLPVSPRRSPTVFPSDSAGCLLNAREAAQRDMYVSGRNFSPGERLEISVVPNQRAWYVDDRVADVTGSGATPAPERVTVGQDGRFTARVWARDQQFNGAFDIVARRLDLGPDLPRGRLAAHDVVSFDRETAYVLYLIYPPGGPHMDVAGRPLGLSPYFQFADGFAETADPVWGAVDPTYVPAGHPGGTYAAYYVVAHRTAAQWAANNSLVDVTPGVEIHPVKAGCVNGTDVVIWDAPLALGKYDVVVEFGTTAATSEPTFSGDGQYDSSIDFLDGAVQVGFQVARDPYELGSYAIGADSYSQDDFFPALGTASNVDLRAVVRYPATVAGTGTPVAPGTHPIFVIEHGNHAHCTPMSTPHASCPPAQRVKNHEGYMRLLDILASHGVIAVSIDAFDLTGPNTMIMPWIPERGRLILKHLELWAHMSNPAQFPTYPDFFAGRFAGHVDVTRVAVSGHSRGGEASVAAYLENAASGAPFTIGSVSSIAPVDFQGYSLPNVPYFVILPAADGDVSSLSGARIFDRAGGAADAATKSLINVYGANHNFFNTVWASDGDEASPARPDYITAPNQQRIGETYLAAFHRAHLLGESVYDDLFRGRLSFPSMAGYKIYPARHESSHLRLLSGGVPAGLVAGGGATLAPVTNPAPHLTVVTRAGWSASGATVTYTVPAGQHDATGFEVLSFRVAQTTSASNPAGNQNFRVELVGGGVTRGVYVGQFDAVPPVYQRPGTLRHTVLTTVRVPLHSFIMNSSGMPLNNIDTVRIQFLVPTTGEIYVDDVEFSR